MFVSSLDLSSEYYIYIYISRFDIFNEVNDKHLKHIIYKTENQIFFSFFLFTYISS